MPRDGTVVYPDGPELLVCVTATPGETATCDCGRPLFTPTLDGQLHGTLTLDWVRCGGCRAHCVVQIVAD